MRRSFLLAIVAIFASAFALWFAVRLPRVSAHRGSRSRRIFTPDGLQFRDGWELRWGQPRRQIALHLGSAADCRDIARNSMGLAHCRVDRHFLPRPFLAGDAWFMHGRFFRLFLVLAPEDYDRVAREVSAGFGHPGTRFASETELDTGARGCQMETDWGNTEVVAVMRLHDGEKGLSSLSTTYEPIADIPPPDDEPAGAG